MNINSVSPSSHGTVTQNNNNQDQFKYFREKLAEILRTKFPIQQNGSASQKSEWYTKSIYSIINDETWHGVEDFKKLNNLILFGIKQIISGLNYFTFSLDYMNLYNDSLWENREIPRPHLLLLDALSERENLTDIDINANNIVTNGNSFYCKFPVSINEILKNNLMFQQETSTVPENPIVNMEVEKNGASLKAPINGAYIYRKIPTTTDELIDKIIKIINNNKEARIGSIALIQNEIKPMHLEKLLKALAGRTIHSILLSANAIGIEGAKLLVKHIKNINIFTLDVRACGIDFESAKALIDSLPRTVPFMDMTVEQIQSPSKTLNQLSLAYNIESPAEQAIISWMARAKGITVYL